jgi:hypothetical protein
MFSFIKKLQILFEKIKSRKGLFFTSLLIATVFAISGFMYIILNMTSNVKTNVYSSIAQNYFKSLDYSIQNKKKRFEEISKAIYLIMIFCKL